MDKIRDAITTMEVEEMDTTMEVEDVETEIIIVETTTMLEDVAEEITLPIITIEVIIITAMEAIPISMAEATITRMVHPRMGITMAEATITRMVHPRMGITLTNTIHVIKVIITTTIVALQMEDGIQTITIMLIII